LKKRSPEAESGSEPYKVTRLRMIRNYDPALNEPDVSKLADASAGLWGKQIEAAVDSFRATGRLPVPPTLSWCREPTTGEYCERLLDPIQVAQDLRDAGFRVRLYTRRIRRLGFLGRMLSSISLRVSAYLAFRYISGFRIVAMAPTRRTGSNLNNRPGS